MTVLSSDTDVNALTLTIVSELDAPAERVWQLWEDPRQLERWWGPPTWPATFDQHDFEVGGTSAYYMTGPDGTRARGWWQITSVDAPRRLEFDDGFADDDGNPVDDLGVIHALVTIEPAGDTTRMTVQSSFTSVEHLEKMIQMGMEEGMRLALGQIDGILSEASA